MIQIRKFNLDEKIYDSEFGDGISSTKYIFEHYYNSKNPEDYFISFTEIDKLGINPQSQYETPLGIYTYPVKEFFETYVDIDSGKLPKDKEWRNIGRFAPFAGEHRWVWVVEIDRSKGKVFDIEQYTPQDYQKDKEKIKDLMFNEMSRTAATYLRRLKVHSKRMDFENTIAAIMEDDLGYSREEANEVFVYEDVIQDFLLENEDVFNAVMEKRMDLLADLSKISSSLAGRMWNITRVLSLTDPVKWNKLFREMGYICAVDRQGEGVIHEMEKTQAVFFQRKYFNVVDKVENIEAATNKIKLGSDGELPNNLALKVIGGLNKLVKDETSGSETIREWRRVLELLERSVFTTTDAYKYANAFNREVFWTLDNNDILFYKEGKHKVMTTIKEIAERLFSKRKNKEFSDVLIKNWNQKIGSTEEIYRID